MEINGKGVAMALQGCCKVLQGLLQGCCKVLQWCCNCVAMCCRVFRSSSKSLCKGDGLQHAWLAKAPFANWPGRKGSVCKLTGPQRICLQTGRAATHLLRTGWSCNTRVSASQQKCFRPQKHSRSSTSHREAGALCFCRV